MDAPSLTPGILTLHTTTANTNFEISLDIPKQTIKLQSVRVQFDSDANALAKRIIYVELPFLSANQLLDNNPGRVNLPILIGHTAVTMEQALQLPIYINGHIPSRFKMRILNSDFTEITNFVSLSLIFTLEKGHLN